MIKTIFRINNENIVWQLHQNKRQNLVTPPRLSYMATPTLLDGAPTLPGDTMVPSGRA